MANIGRRGQRRRAEPPAQAREQPSDTRRPGTSARCRTRRRMRRSWRSRSAGPRRRAAAVRVARGAGAAARGAHQVAPARLHAEAAVVLVRLQVHAGRAALRETGAAAVLARPVAADLAPDAARVAGAAVGGARAQVDARARPAAAGSHPERADHLAGGARTRTVVARRPGGARVAAAAAVGRARRRVDAPPGAHPAAGAERLAGRAASFAHAGDALVAGAAPVAATAAVRGVRGGVHARGAALRGARRARAHGVDTRGARGAALVACAAVERVAREVHASAGAVRELRAAHGGARAAGADLAGRTRVAAGAAVVRVAPRLGADAVAPLPVEARADAELARRPRRRRRSRKPPQLPLSDVSFTQDAPQTEKPAPHASVHMPAVHC